MGAPMKKMLTRDIVIAAIILISLFFAAPARAEILTISCSGGFVRTITKSQYNDSFTISSSAYTGIPDARIVFQVPDGANYCVKVRFSAVVKCDTATSTQSCYVRPTMTNYFFSPASAGYTSSSSWGAHSFEWTARANQVGKKIIQMQAQSNDAVDFDFANWTLTVELFE
jgi:hypothetical protein